MKSLNNFQNALCSDFKLCAHTKTGIFHLIESKHKFQNNGKNFFHPLFQENIHFLLTVKAPNIAHLSLLNSVGYTKKETKLKKCTQPNKVIIIYNIHRVQNEKYFPHL